MFTPNLPRRSISGAGRRGRAVVNSPVPLGEMMPLSATLSHPNEGRRTFKELACNYRFPVLQQTSPGNQFGGRIPVYKLR